MIMSFDDLMKSFDDLMKYLLRCLRAMERDPEEWVDMANPVKKNINNNTRSRFTNNGISRVSTNPAVTTVETVTTAKPNNLT